MEAMANNRPYRPGLGIDVACEEIRRGAGTLYDPEVARTLIQLVDNKAINFNQGQGG